ncbi:MAG TPA: UbiA family prenyltransferase [Thermoplasmata archaeon]|nr:UbiA family prenyltransferase [Thermoplasmata archaeon]
MAGGGDGPRITKEILVTPSDLSELIVSLGGVKFWVVAMVPLYIGWVLAQPAATRHLFVDDIGIVLAFLVIGPFLSTFTLLFNTYYDMGTTDRANPRKKYVRMVEEVVDRETLLWASLGFAALGLLLAAYVSGNFVSYAGQDVSGPVTRVVGVHGFTVIMALVAALSVAYSHPRIRWKGVAGMDLVTNMVGFGVLCPLGGWVLQRPIEQAPWGYIATIALFLGAVYAPTTASDYAADKAYGIRTMAVRLGVRGTLALGFGLQLAAVLSLAIGWSQRWFPFDTAAYDAMGPLWPFVALQVVFYGLFIRRPSVGNLWALLLLLAIAQGLGVILMLWGFVGGRAFGP